MVHGAADVTIPAEFNAATYFVDRHIDDGRGEKVAIECGDERITYRQLAERVNQVGHALRDRLDVRPEERVLLLLHDTPEFIYSFFGAIKIGAVPVPISTMWKAADYEYVLRDSRARIVIIDGALLPVLQATSTDSRRHLRHIVGVRTASTDDALSWPDLVDAAPVTLEGETTSCDDVAFWLYSSGSTGAPKGCVHLQHDMVVCTERYARDTLGMTESDRTFSVAKLFFAYGLGNAMYFPLALGASTILWPGPPTAGHVYSVIERHRPTLLFSVPTSYAMLLAHHGDDREFDLASGAMACRRARRFRPPSSSGSGSGSGWRFSTGSARPRSSTSSSPIGLAPSARGRVARWCVDMRHGSSTSTNVPLATARSVTFSSRVTPRARITGTSTRRLKKRSRAHGSVLVTSTGRMLTAISFSPVARTTC
jgi:acyl-CoA synthetase (AMP-forming)/AMP-acid ligase II